MRAILPITFLIVAATAVGCQSNQTSPSPPNTSNSGSSSNTRSTAAYVNGEQATRDQLYKVLVETNGGEALAELILDRAIDKRLATEGMALTEADIEAERQRLLDELSPDPDQAARLFNEMRNKFGLGTTRYQAMVRRNAGLRKLVADGIKVTEPAINQAYQLRYGSRYRVRLITSENASQLNRARQRVLGGTSFTDLAIELSTDASAAQGGLLSPINTADATYPKAVRDVLAKLSTDSEQARLSPVIALPEGYALLRLEEIVTPESPAYAEVRPSLIVAVRRDLERVRMQQLARALLEQADVVVLDPALEKSWQQHREKVTKPQ